MSCILTTDCNITEDSSGVLCPVALTSGLDAYIIEAPADVEFCEVFSSAELRDEFGDEGERISVLDGHGVQCAIVLD